MIRDKTNIFNSLRTQNPRNFEAIIKPIDSSKHSGTREIPLETGNPLIQSFDSFDLTSKLSGSLLQNYQTENFDPKKIQRQEQSSFERHSAWEYILPRRVLVSASADRSFSFEDAESAAAMISRFDGTDTDVDGSWGVTKTQGPTEVVGLMRPVRTISLKISGLFSSEETKDIKVSRKFGNVGPEQDHESQHYIFETSTLGGFTEDKGIQDMIDYLAQRPAHPEAE